MSAGLGHRFAPKPDTGPEGYIASRIGLDKRRYMRQCVSISVLHPWSGYVHISGLTAFCILLLQMTAVFSHSSGPRYYKCGRSNKNGVRA